MSRWVSPDGLIPFRPNETEHPDVNYAHIPIRALNQLQKLIDYFFQNNATLDCPVNLFQSDEDPVVVPDSVHKLYKHIVAPEKQIVMINSKRHGIVYEDIDNTQSKIMHAVLSKSSLMHKSLTYDSGKPIES
jgi:esterase/lipase